MEVAIKRKNIDLPVDVLQKLSLAAVSKSMSLKAYIEDILISKANQISVEVTENPSPSGDEWFDDPENLRMVYEGIEQMKRGEMKAYTRDEIEKLLGLK